MYGKTLLIGDLTFVSLADVFQMLGGTNRTGVLRITSPYVPTPGMIYFVNGAPVNATCGPLSGVDAVYALFGWIEGKFEFHQQSVHVEHVVKRSRLAIVLDAMRMLDEGVIKRVAPPSHDEVSATQKDESKYRKSSPPRAIKIPLIDYTYVTDEEEFRDGQRITKEGAHGNWIWVVLEGAVKVSRDTPKGTIHIARLGEGCLIGGFSCFLIGGHVRSATVTAAGNVQLGVLDTHRLTQEYAFLSSDLRGLLDSLDARLVKVTDRAVELFIKKEDSNGLSNAKKTIIKEGSSKERVFAIAEGQAHVVRKTPRGNLRLLTLEKGDVLGYLPFVDIGHEPRSASVLASKHLKLKELKKESLQKEYDNLSTAFRCLIENVAICISMTTRLVCRLPERT